MTLNQDSCLVKTILIGGGVLVGGVAIGYLIGLKAAQKKAHVNQAVKKDTDKVVDTVDMEDIGEKKVFCRCWRSSKFPYCDGTHNKHNAATGDNVGPLIVKGQAAQ
uniref:Iron-binding zinc finger CDGSH type domain-containing protein n=1 Tax=Acrobeloides nanus TaxID=290746 RepID=A0A914D6Z6_9BILA